MRRFWCGLKSFNNIKRFLFLGLIYEKKYHVDIQEVMTAALNLNVWAVVILLEHGNFFLILIPWDSYVLFVFKGLMLQPASKSLNRWLKYWKVLCKLLDWNIHMQASFTLSWTKFAPQRLFNLKNEGGRAKKHAFFGHYLKNW